MHSGRAGWGRAQVRACLVWSGLVWQQATQPTLATQFFFTAPADHRAEMCIMYIVCSCEVDVTSWSLTQLAHAAMQHARHHSTTNIPHLVGALFGRGHTLGHLHLGTDSLCQWESGGTGHKLDDSKEMSRVISPRADEEAGSGSGRKRSMSFRGCTLLW